MPKLLSDDLRLRVVCAIDGGMSRRQAAARFDVAPSTAIRWYEAWLRTGSCRAKRQGGDRWSHVTEAHANRILAILDVAGDITLVELKARLGETGGTVSISALSRFFRRHGITRKKDRPCGRAGPCGHPRPPACLVRRPGRARARAADFHRRDMGEHEDGSHPRPMRRR
ncbi:transposase [Stappia sp. 22II-S9-Z10]|nr:transposase [Stappia sp. 22II-S9-Z10]